MMFAFHGLTELEIVQNTKFSVTNLTKLLNKLFALILLPELDNEREQPSALDRHLVVRFCV